jgi:hypothetical protein
MKRHYTLPSLCVVLLIVVLGGTAINNAVGNRSDSSDSKSNSIVANANALALPPQEDKPLYPGAHAVTIGKAEPSDGLRTLCQTGATLQRAVGNAISEAYTTFRNMPTNINTITYEEIEEERIRIANRDGDASISTAEFEAMEVYAETLAGKKVIDWNGWVDHMTPNKEGVERRESQGDGPQTISVIILLEAPCNPARLDKRCDRSIARLYEVDRQQLQPLVAWNDDLTPVWEQATFSGTIVEAKLGSILQLTLYDTTISPAYPKK